jgi:hypothetical protein
MKRILAVTATVLALGLGLSACETATPYQPAAPGAAQAGGYSEVRIEPDRYRVTFAGNSMTTRATVESYLLYRAAELTLNQGFDWFEMVDRNTDKHVTTWADPDPFYGAYGFGWHPYWRYYRHGFGWRGWDPYWGDPFWDRDIDIHTIEKYEATAEIVMHHGPKPEGDHRAFDARVVIENLNSKIVRPT